MWPIYQGMYIVDEGKFFFVEVFYLINEEEMLEVDITILQDWMNQWI